MEQHHRQIAAEIRAASKDKIKADDSCIGVLQGKEQKVLHTVSVETAPTILSVGRAVCYLGLVDGCPGYRQTM